jgi:hypothetical protein
MKYFIISTLLIILICFSVVPTTVLASKLSDVNIFYTSIDVYTIYVNVITQTPTHAVTSAIVPFLIGASIGGFIGFIVGYQLGASQFHGVPVDLYVKDMSSLASSWAYMGGVALKSTTTFLNHTYTYVASYGCTYSISMCGGDPSVVSRSSTYQSLIVSGFKKYLTMVFNFTTMWVGELGKISQYLQWRYVDAGMTGNYFSIDGSLVLTDLNGNPITPPSSITSLTSKTYVSLRGSGLKLVGMLSYSPTTSDTITYLTPSQFVVDQNVVDEILNALVDGEDVLVSVSVTYGTTEYFISDVRVRKGNTYELVVSPSSVVMSVLDNLKFLISNVRKTIYSYISVMNEVGCQVSPLPLPTELMIDPNIISKLDEGERLRIYIAYLNALSSYDWSVIKDKLPLISTISSPNTFVGSVREYGVSGEVYIVDFGKPVLNIREGMNILDTWALAIVKSGDTYYYLYLPTGSTLTSDRSLILYRTTVSDLLSIYGVQLQLIPTPPEKTFWQYLGLGVLVGIILALILSRKRLVSSKNIY